MRRRPERPTEIGRGPGAEGTRHLLLAYCVPSRVFTSALFCHQNREMSGLPLLVHHELRLQLLRSVDWACLMLGKLGIPEVLWTKWERGNLRSWFGPRREGDELKVKQEGNSGSPVAHTKHQANPPANQQVAHV